MEIILKNQDSLKTASSPAQQVEIRMKNVAAYTTMGRHENAIDELITIVEKNPENPDAFKLLAEFYEIKRCYSLALKYCQRLKTIEPNSAIVNRKIQELSSQL
jgi:tetratricopeptide (TPR) repeat protein